MKEIFHYKLFNRELAQYDAPATRYRKLYSDISLVRDLDIVNELEGHSGCVNALSWSKSGSLLASGSDDQHLNIHTYQPTGVNSQFQLTATVATGHTQNIFSVKFMPHSQDRTVITAAGDGEVRIFDLEYAGRAHTASPAASLATEGRRRGRQTLFDGVKYMSDGDTNCRVYRSHSDRVKRIVTESSPHLFLTCSEDGEVRQWDLRLPSSAYPPVRGFRAGGVSADHVPPPLISYKRYNLDLNTISCSASQPHYIALGGAHLHAFLHDRRMSGRDLLAERGVPLSRPENLSLEDQERLSQATRCVRKFAPKGQKRMTQADNGHITACKISDARPDEMIVSWSGDHIYSFDLIRDNQEENSDEALTAKKERVKQSQERKRKRKVTGSDGSSERRRAVRSASCQRVESSSQHTETALRVRYQNGQSEDIPLTTNKLTEAQRDAQRIARAVLRIRSSLFGAAPSTATGASTTDPTARFTQALGRCASILADIDERIRSWRYPLAPSPEQVYAQRTLRRQREATRRFVQTAGTLARVLGGRLQTPSSGPQNPMLEQFVSVDVSATHLELPRVERFAYDFLKAILMWLDSGIGQLVEGFTRPADVRASSKAGARLPIPEDDATTEAVEEYLVPYLLALAGDEPIVDVEVNRFETAERRHVFPNQKAAVIAWAAAARVPFADLSAAVMEAEGEENAVQAQDRAAARRFWAGKVARGLLLDVAKEAGKYLVVDRAFGGKGVVVPALEAEEAELEGIAEGEEESGEEVVEAEVVGAEREDVEDDEADASGDEEEDEEELEIVLDDEEEEDDDTDDEEDGDEFDVEEDDGDETVEESSDLDEEDGVPNLGMPRFIYRSAFERRRLRPHVEADVPCSRPTRSYRGHCNVRTVKDVNYFGPSDEYVLSGSDDGNFFIWDRKSGELVNLLSGDDEVVNVIQPHPYEPLLAVSGIDHTVKIFSPDARARQVARLGHGVAARDGASFSSLSWPTRRYRGPIGVRRSGGSTGGGGDGGGDSAEPEPLLTAEEQAAAAQEDDEYVAPQGLASRKRMQDSYRIIQSNNLEREGGNQEAVITVCLFLPSLFPFRHVFPLAP